MFATDDRGWPINMFFAKMSRNTNVRHGKATNSDSRKDYLDTITQSISIRSNRGITVAVLRRRGGRGSGVEELRRGLPHAGLVLAFVGVVRGLLVLHHDGLVWARESGKLRQGVRFRVSGPDFWIFQTRNRN